MNNVCKCKGVITVSLLIALLGLFGLASNAGADPVTGAIFTTDANANQVNGNIYANCCDVYLNGGPPPNKCDAAGLPDGYYYYQVTDPSGATLLSSDDISQRMVHVVGGLIIESSAQPDGTCTHPDCTAAIPTTGTGHNLGTGKCVATVPKNITVQLMPFCPTPNPGGEYKVWMTPVSDYDPNFASDGVNSNFGFIDSKSKTDNFKCLDNISACQQALCIICPSDIEQCNDAGKACAVVTFDPPVAQSGVALQNIVCTNQDGLVVTSGTTCFPIGTTVVTCTAEDALQNTAICSFNIIVDDCLQITCPGNITNCVPPGTTGSIVVYPSPTTSGGDGSKIEVSCTPKSGSSFPTGVDTVTCTASDQNTNVTCSFDVVVSDDPTTCPSSECTAPVLTDTNVCICSGTGAIVNYPDPTAPSGETFVECDPPSGSVFTVGSTPVTCYFLSSGVECSSPFNVVVQVDVPQLNAGPTNACYKSLADAKNAAIGATTGTDCFGNPVTKFDATDDGQTCPATITVKGTDTCGNTAQVQYQMKILATGPTLSGCPNPTSSLVQCVTDIPTAPTGITAKDACLTDLTTAISFLEKQSNPTSTCSNVITRTWSVTDCAGNSASCSQVVTQWNTTLPTVTKGTISCYYSSLTAADAAAVAATTATASCGGTIASKIATDDGKSCPATIKVTATDTCGNSKCVSYTANILSGPPTIHCPGTITTNAASCSVAQNVKFSVTASDVCAGTLTPVCTNSSGTVVTSGSSFPIGSTTVTCYAIGTCSLSSSCSFTVTVNETTSGTCGGLTMGFWQNKNGGAIILGATEPALANYLTAYCPFKDLTSTTASGVSNYIYSVIKAANAGGASMNAMLKAQMLATALNVYFSDTTKGGNKIGASKPLGTVKLDLTKVCKPTDSSGGTATCSGTAENTMAAFNGTVTGCQGTFSLSLRTCVAVSDLLDAASKAAAAATASNPGASKWYGDNKTTQGLAKDTFDAFNNGFTFVCGP